MISLYGARELSYHVMVGYGFALVRIGMDWFGLKWVGFLPKAFPKKFLATGCRDMELAHLNDTDLLVSKEIYIREKPCQW